MIKNPSFPKEPRQKILGVPPPGIFSRLLIFYPGKNRQKIVPQKCLNMRQSQKLVPQKIIFSKILFFVFYTKSGIFRSKPSTCCEPFSTPPSVPHFSTFCPFFLLNGLHITDVVYRPLIWWSNRSFSVSFNKK